MTDDEIDAMEDQVPVVAVAALNAASEAARDSDLPRVIVIDDGLYRVFPSGEKQLIRMLPKWQSTEDIKIGHKA